MKFILLLLTFSLLSFAEEDCPPEESAAITSITSLSVPNCINRDQIDEEISVSITSQERRGSQSSSTLSSPICRDCQSRFNSRLSEQQDLKEKRKKAFFKTAYRELEKSLSAIVVDMVGIRKSYNYNSDFKKSADSCKTDQIESQLRKCNREAADLFHSENLSQRMASEVVRLISNASTQNSGILSRPQELNSCSITDETIASLRPRLFEESISPDIVKKLSEINAQNSFDLQTQIISKIGQQQATLLSTHPALRELIKEPATFLSTFRSLRTFSDTTRLKNEFRAKMYSPEMGSLIDSKNSQKCEQTIQSFTQSLCSKAYDNSDISVGPFSNYGKFANDDELDESPATTSDAQIANNQLMFEFCQEFPGRKLSLNNVLDRMNNWMLTSDKRASLAEYASTKYNRDFGDTKSALCNYLPASDCNISEGDQCALYKIYRRSLNPNSPEGRLASSSDRGVNSVIRSLIGSGDISSQAREVLVAEGILPQPNGQFAERPTPPERDSGYLAGVADGSITPNTGSTQLAARSPQRQQPTQPQAQQQAVFQPQTQIAASGAGNSAIQPSSDEDDSEASRSVFNDLEQRRLRGQTSDQVANAPQRQTTQPRRSGNPDANLPQVSPAAVASAPIPAGGNGFVAPTFAPQNPTEARLDRDPSAQTRAQRDRNAALADMQGARNNPSAAVGGGRNPASTDGQAGVVGDQTVAITLTGDIRANLERVLSGSDANGADLRNKIRDQVPFRFQLNNQMFDVQFNNGTCVVTSRGSDSRNAELARTLQGVFNSSIRTGRSTASRNTTLPALRDNLR